MLAVPGLMKIICVPLTASSSLVQSKLNNGITPLSEIAQLALG